MNQDSNFCDAALSPIGRTHTEAVAERMKNPEYREEYERIKQRRDLEVARQVFTSEFPRWKRRNS